MALRNDSRFRAVLITTALVVAGGSIDFVQAPIVQLLSGLFAGSPSLSPLWLTIDFALSYGWTLLVAVVFLYVTKRGLSYFDLHRPTRWGVVYIIGGVLARLGAEIAIEIANSVFNLTPAQDNTLSAILTGGTATATTGVILIVFVAVPVEELFYRNTVQKRLGENFSGAVAILVAGLLFGLSHVPTYFEPAIGALISPFASNFLGGIIYGVIYFRTQNITTPILAHGLYNAVGIALTLI